MSLLAVRKYCCMILSILGKGKRSRKRLFFCGKIFDLWYDVFMSELRLIKDRIKKFNSDRDWERFHNPKDVALSLSLEASEVLEHFQWKSDEDIKNFSEAKKEEMSDELADVLYWVVYLSDIMGINILDSFNNKMKKNEEKYPIEKSKGKSTKYTNL